MTERSSFVLGNELHTVDPIDITPETTLNQYLREKAHLTGTKRMCLEGGCGACVVAIEHYDQNSQKYKFFAINSCLVSIFSCHHWKIHTVEGIGGPLSEYHPIQKGLAEGNGSQCGFCSPGMVMNMFALLENGPLTAEQIENSFGGNICRCTGYRTILESFKKFAVTDIEDYKPCKPSTCKSTCNIRCTKNKSLFYEKGETKWLKVYIFDDLLQTLGTLQGTYRLVAGNTARGVYKNDPNPSTYIDIASVSELINWYQVENALVIGGNMSLTETMALFNEISKQIPQLSYLSKMATHIDLVANVPVRNIGTLAGNLMIKHTHREFQSDIFLILETVAATLVIVDTTGNEIRVTPKKFLEVDMNKKIIKCIILRGYDSPYIYGSYKIMPRAQNAHAVVNAGFFFNIQNGNVRNATIVYGGINPQFVHATNTEMYVVNKNLFDNKILQGAFQTLSDELKPDHVLPDLTPEYRKNLAISLLYKFILSITPNLAISSKNKSGGSLLQRPVSTASQEFSTNIITYPVSKPIIKIEALNQTSGNAEYIEDIPNLPGQLYAQFVVAKAVAGSVILKIDPTEALKIPGVVSFLGKEDIPGENNWTPITKMIIFVSKEELFCSSKVEYYDQPVGIIVAKSQKLAIAAADLVTVTCTPPSGKPVLNIKEVVNSHDLFKKLRIIHVIDIVPKRRGSDIKKVIKGEFYVDLQYHFHMEVQCCSVVPVEDGLNVFASTQWMDATQIGISNVLGIHQSKVNVQVRRLGGGFGGKILRNGMVSAATSLAAYKLKKPVKMRLPMEKNMHILGKRCPFYVKYEVGVNAQGVIQYLEADLYSDYGTGVNENIFIFLLDGFRSGYQNDTWNFSYSMVKTDKPANAWARAPGTLEGIGAIETIMEHIASTLGIDVFEVKKANIDTSKYGKLMDYCKEILVWSDIERTKKDIAKFNQENRWKKRGLSIVPMVWTLTVIGAYPVLVSIYHGDGSVSVTHGGVEMGQGINTKVAQVCAYKLGVSMDMVSVKPSCTISSPNAFPSGGSLTSEAVCWATLQACEVILKRLEPFKNKLGGPVWILLVQAAFYANVQLSATTHFYPHLPDLVNYPIYGTAAVQVEVDILTGQHQITNVDIIEDVGVSMNPLIDIGQLEGAFLMGIGYYTTEQIVYNDKGQLLTDRTWNYHPPGAKDIPQKFRIKFPPNNPNNVGVLHSKAIGEPPICLSVAVPLAIRNAVASARNESDNSKPEWYPMDGCSTIENTFLNSLNNFKQYTL